MNAFSWMQWSPRKLVEPTLDVCEEIRVTQNKRRITFRPDDNKITYQNVISPAEGGIRYPQEFFDKKTAYIPLNEMEACKLIIGKALAQLSLKEPQGPPAPGASCSSVLVFRYHDGREVSCSDTFPAPSPSVKSEKIPGFLVIYHLLNSYCAVSADWNAQYPRISEPPRNDPGYFEETCWFCKKCLTNNSLKQRFCRKCGEYRGW